MSTKKDITSKTQENKNEKQPEDLESKSGIQLKVKTDFVRNAIENFQPNIPTHRYYKLYAIIILTITAEILILILAHWHWLYLLISGCVAIVIIGLCLYTRKRLVRENCRKDNESGPIQVKENLSKIREQYPIAYKNYELQEMEREKPAREQERLRQQKENRLRRERENQRKQSSYISRNNYDSSSVKSYYFNDSFGVDYSYGGAKSSSDHTNYVSFGVISYGNQSWGDDSG
ncbi:hypothetical protein M0813_17944 [Anaeramoeba flamelloides]|uniref:Uncharacterized protein n=1 Tax=Anaeramoeba flamelloides TaxID=1746091 RepID=A0ABQ8YV61_9EUKA|nr:hypothetical protein M0813_17944 [Anaeramoeba flamelloides]